MSLLTEKLTRREREIMDVLFALGDHGSVEDIRGRLTDAPSYSAVRAMLVKLEAKGFVKHREEGLRYVYVPTTSRATALLKQENWSDNEIEALRAEIEQVRKNRRQ